MSINKNGSINYKLPEKYNKMLTKDFIKAFVKELHIIMHHSLEDYELDTIAYETGTGGWTEAFINACRKTDSGELARYYTSLPWYDSDLFDEILEDKIEENRLIIPGSRFSQVSMQNNLPEIKILQCVHCGKYFNIDDIKHKIGDKEFFQCDECNGRVLSYPPLKYDRMKALEYIGYEADDKAVFCCEKCGKMQLSAHKGKKYCLSCENPSLPGTNVSQYYKDSCEINKKYMDSIPPKSPSDCE